MLLNDLEERLPAAEMISIGNSRHVRMWWSMNGPSELMDQLFCGHRTGGKDGAPPPAASILALVIIGANLPICLFIVISQTQTASSPSCPLQPQRDSPG